MNDLTTYYEYRDQMDTWDLLTYRTQGVISTIIHAWSPDNHAGGVLRLPEYEGEEHRRWTLEAVGGGVRVAHLSDILAKVHGEVYWHQLKPEYNHLRNAIGCWALTKAGVTKYDFKSLLQMAFGVVSADAAKLICSEYYYLGLCEAKIVENNWIPSPSGLPKLGVTLPGIRIIKSEMIADEQMVVQP